VLSVLEQQQAIEAHVRGFFNNSPIELFSWELGGIKDSIPFFRVMRLQQGNKWVYISNGASIQRKAGNYGVEFVIISPREEPRMVELLAMVSHFHSAPRHQPLDVGSTIAIGEPWLEESTCNHLLLSLPYPFGPRLEWFHMTDAAHARFTWLVPVTEDEAIFAGEHGIEPLEELFEKAQLNYLSVNRSSVLEQNS